MRQVVVSITIAVIFVGVLGLIAWTSSVDAQDGLEPRVDALETRVAALETAITGPALAQATPGAHAFTGTGQQVVDIGRLEQGSYLVRGSCEGDGQIFDVELTGRQTDDLEFVFSIETCPFTGSTIVHIYEADDFLMEVAARTPWRISFEAV